MKTFRLVGVLAVLAAAAILVTARLHAPLAPPFLSTTPHIDFGEPVFARTITEVVDEYATLEQKLARIFYFVRDGFPFSADAVSLRASEALESRQGICYTKAMVFVGLCRRLGVPARLATARFTIRGDPAAATHEHGIASIQMGGQWFYIDTVSNRDAWRSWGIPDTVRFEPPVFSISRHVVADDEFVAGLTFEDAATDDVPAEWLARMERFLQNGQW